MSWITENVRFLMQQYYMFVFQEKTLYLGKFILIDEIFNQQVDKRKDL